RDFPFSDPSSCDFPAREVSRRAALCHVCSGPEAQPGDILFLQDPEQWSEVSGRRCQTSHPAQRFSAALLHSTPGSSASGSVGPYATLGLAEDTWALNEEVLDDQAFLAQCYSNHDDRERMLFDALEKTRQGLCACVFDTTDRVQHMFWRYLEEDHPAARGIPREQRPKVIEDLYRRMDALIGRVMKQIDGKTLLLVVSDHGFKSFARCVNLNAWLHQNGYLALKPERTESGDWFEDVDWSRTIAYIRGLNGLYLNLRGRERQGIVEPGDKAEVLKKELREKLDGLVDPASSR